MFEVSKVVKINYTWNSKERQMPYIKISGMWLHDLGFKSGFTCFVKGEYGKMTLKLMGDDSYSFNLTDA